MASIVAGSGLFELMEIVIRQRLFEWNLDGGGGLGFVGGRFEWTWWDMVFTPTRAIFWVGAAGEDGEGRGRAARRA